MKKKMLYIGVLPIIATPLLTIISCSSNNKQESLDKEAAKFTNRETLITDSTASLAKENIEENSSKLTDYYSINLTNGFNYLYKSSDVETTTLKVVVTLTEVSTNKTKDVSFNITGFAQIEVSNLEKEARRFTNRETLIKDLTASLAKKNIDDDQGKLIDYYSISLTNGFNYLYKGSDVETTTLKVVVTLTEVSTNKTKDVSFNITGFVAPSNIEFEKGGTTSDGLEVSKYLILVNSLNLNKSTTISSLTNEKLTTKLKSKPEFSNLSLTILGQSSEISGNLHLKLSGIYDGINQDGEIIIKNFFTFKNNSSYNIEGLHLNKNIYFENFQTPDKIDSWTQEDWIKYIEKLNIWSSNDADNKFEINVIDLLNTKRIDSLVFDKNKKQFKSSLSFKEYNLITNTWEVKGENKNLFFKIDNHLFEKFIPTQDDAKKYILINLKLINENIWREQYPSFYFRKFNGGLSQMEQYFVLPERMVETYFSNEQLYIKTESIKSTNDFAGTFTLNIKLMDSKNEDDHTFWREFKLTGLKTIGNIFNDDKEKEIVTNLNQKQLKKIAKNIGINDLKTMKTGETKEFTNLSYFTSLFELPLLTMLEDKVQENYLDTLDNFYKREIKFSLLRQKLRDSFDRQGLFGFKDGTPFGIKYIGIEFLDENNKTTTVTRTTDNNWDISTKFKYTIQLFDEEIEREGVLISSISEADWA